VAYRHGGVRKNRGIAVMTGKSFEQIMRAAGIATAMRRDHLRRPSAKTPILVLLDLIELGGLDLWIEDQPDPKPSRQEAARRLINEALMRE
jgi:hypothetical protein